MAKLTIDTTSIIEIMSVDGIDNRVTANTRAVIATLCNVGAITDNHLPRAIFTLRPWLAEQLPWLDAAVKLVADSHDNCTDCVLDPEDKGAYVELCPMIRAIAAIVAMFGATVEVEPLPRGAYEQPAAPTYMPDCNRLN